MLTLHSSQELKCRYLFALQSPAERRRLNWAELWELFLGDPWYQEQLDRCARRALRRTSGRLDWLEDIKQDAVVALAVKLRRKPDLGIDPRRADGHFEGWISTIIDRDCRASLRRLRNAHPWKHELPQHESCKDIRLDTDGWIDISLILNRLHEPLRTIMTLRVKGMEPRQIAEALGISYWKALRAVRQGVAVLRERLGS